LTSNQLMAVLNRCVFRSAFWNDSIFSLHTSTPAQPLGQSLMGDRSFMSVGPITSS